MSNDSIRTALDTRLSTYVPISVSTLAIAWEAGPHFKPVANTPYLAQFFLPAKAETAGIGVTAPTRHLGIYQVNVFWPTGVGQGAAQREADGVVAHFSRGLGLLEDSIKTVVLETWAGAPMIHEAWLMVPVSIPYFAHAFPA